MPTSDLNTAWEQRFKDLNVLWGKRLKDLRTGLGLSQMALAAKAGIDSGYYTRIENGQMGRRGVGDDVKMRLAAALFIRVERIWEYPDTSKGLPAEFDSAPKRTA